MSGRDSIQSLLVRRKLTRAIADAVKTHVIDYLATMTPLLQPKAVLGDYIQGGVREPNHKADKALKEVQAVYEKVASTKPFNLPRELTPPFSLTNLGLEITPLDYAHVVDSKKILVRRPLTWVLSYTGYSTTRLQELLDTRTRSADALQRFVISHLVLHVAIKTQPGVSQIFNALHFPISSGHLPEFGELPITQVGVGISTARPSDAVIAQSAELTGMDAFEEVVNPEEIPLMPDPLKDRLLEIARQQAPELV